MTQVPRITARHQRGLTLIELLVVISIIGILSSMGLASFASARTKAQYANAQADLLQISRAAMVAQGETSLRLQSITGSSCSDCACRNKNLRNIPDTDACYIRWIDSLARIQDEAASAVTGIDMISRDPWGSPYGLDENEREQGAADCRLDTIRSAGPDGVLYTSDDESYDIPHSRPCP